MSAEDSLGNRDTASCKVRGCGRWLGSLLLMEGTTNSGFAGDIGAVSGGSDGGNLSGTGHLLFMLVTRLFLLLINLICKRWGLQHQIFFIWFLLFRIICNFHLWTVALCRNSLYGSEFICIALLAWLWFSLTVTSTGKRRMELDMKNCFVLQCF